MNVWSEARALQARYMEEVSKEADAALGDLSTGNIERAEYGIYEMASNLSGSFNAPWGMNLEAYHRVVASVDQLTAFDQAISGQGFIGQRPFISDNGQVWKVEFPLSKEEVAAPEMAERLTTIRDLTKNWGAQLREPAPYDPVNTHV